MKKLTILALVASLFAINAFAHPGRTAADGCHYCRTNCDKWRVQHGERHCHGGLKPELQIEIMKSAASNKGEPSKLEVTHTHDSNHSHKEQYN